MGLPRWPSDKETACQRRRRRRHKRGGLDPGVRKILWRKKWQQTQVFLSGEFHGQGTLMGCSPWGRRVRHGLVTEHAWMFLVECSPLSLMFSCLWWWGRWRVAEYWLWQSFGYIVLPLVVSSGTDMHERCIFWIVAHHALLCSERGKTS